MKNLTKYGHTHRILTIAIPLLCLLFVGYFNVNPNQGMGTFIGPLAFTSFVIGAYFFVQKLRYQFRDNNALSRLVDKRYELSEYTPEGRELFISTASLEAYEQLAEDNGLRLVVNKERTVAKVNKSHLNNFRRNSNKP